MLLRRVTQHVKEQNWFAVALDFLIVVFGVLLAIQVSNWNADRADRERGIIYEQRAQSVLQTELNRLDVQIRYYQKVRASALRAADMLEGRAPIIPDELVFHLYRATEYTYASPGRATYEEIVSNGGLGLIEDDNVRFAMVAFYAYDNALEISQSFRLSSYRTLVRSHMPLNVQQAIRLNCSDTFDEFGRIDDLTDGCELDLPESLIEEAAAALMARDNLLPELRQHVSLLNVAIGNLEGARRLADILPDTDGG